VFRAGGHGLWVCIQTAALLCPNPFYPGFRFAALHCTPGY